MRRRAPNPDPGLPPVRLQRFRAGEWCDPGELWAGGFPVAYAAWRRYSEARKAWLKSHGMTTTQLDKLIPKPVVVDRPSGLDRHRGGADAA